MEGASIRKKKTHQVMPLKKNLTKFSCMCALISLQRPYQVKSSSDWIILSYRLIKFVSLDDTVQISRFCLRFQNVIEIIFRFSSSCIQFSYCRTVEIGLSYVWLKHPQFRSCSSLCVSLFFTYTFRDTISYFSSNAPVFWLFWWVIYYYSKRLNSLEWKIF